MTENNVYIGFGARRRWKIGEIVFDAVSLHKICMIRGRIAMEKSSFFLEMGKQIIKSYELSYAIFSGLVIWL